MATLLAVPTTLKTAKASVPSAPTSSSMFCAVSGRVVLVVLVVVLDLVRRCRRSRRRRRRSPSRSMPSSRGRSRRTPRSGPTGESSTPAGWCRPRSRRSGRLTQSSVGMLDSAVAAAAARRRYRRSVSSSSSRWLQALLPSSASAISDAMRPGTTTAEHVALLGPSCCLTPRTRSTVGPHTVGPLATLPGRPGGDVGGRRRCADLRRPSRASSGRTPPTTPSGSTNTMAMRAAPRWRAPGSPCPRSGPRCSGAAARAASAPTAGPRMVAAPPMTTATRNSIGPLEVEDGVGAGRDAVDQDRQRAGHAGVGGARWRRWPPWCAARFTPDRGGRQFLVAHGDHGPARPAPDQVPRQHEHARTAMTRQRK